MFNLLFAILSESTKEWDLATNVANAHLTSGRDNLIGINHIPSCMVIAQGHNDFFSPSPNYLQRRFFFLL